MHLPDLLSFSALFRLQPFLPACRAAVTIPAFSQDVPQLSTHMYVVCSGQKGQAADNVNHKLEEITLEQPCHWMGLQLDGPFDFA